MMKSTVDLRLGDAHALIQSLPSHSVDAIITDPPYGVFKNVDAHLDTPPRPEIWHECYRVAKRDAWLAVFCQMPILAQWHAEITQAGWRYVEHIVWLKRAITPTNSGLSKGHESILLYRKGKARFRDTNAPWWDTRIPLLEWGGIDLSAVEKFLSDMWYMAQTGKLKSVKRIHYDTLLSNRFRKDSYAPDYSKMRMTNVWSFLKRGISPANKNKASPFEKPLPLLERLVRLLTCEGQVVLDPFLGSGTTAVACAKLNRACIGFEYNAQYLQIAQKRVCEAQGLLGER